jgi:hypothetical protein
VEKLRAQTEYQLAVRSSRLPRPPTQKIVNRLLNMIVNAASRFKVSEEAFFIRLWEILRFQVAYITSNNHSDESVYELQKSFAGHFEELALENLLKQRALIEQLKNSPFPFFSANIETGKIRCAGRKLSYDRLILILKWPTETGA